MKLEDCKIGTVVCTIDREGSVEEVGVVVGISNCCSYGSLATRKDPRRAIPLVQFACNSNHRAISHKKIFPFKDSFLEGE